LNGCVVAHCRAGFEPEAAADLHAAAARLRETVRPHVEVGAGFVAAQTEEAPDIARWSSALTANAPIFARSVFIGSGPWTLTGTSRSGPPDRITPLVAAARSLASAPFGTVWLEHPDTNDGKALSTLARGLHHRLAGALRDANLLREDESATPRLHVLLRDGATAWVGVSDAHAGSPWPMGIPRLRMPRGAPSRSTLKLAEALVTFLGSDERRLLRAGSRAVDLGAAPGGWTWQLAQRGLRVTAVDNGALKGEVAHDALVTHLREDGLRYRPRRPVDWVTCDIVEKPSRIAALMADWIGAGHARHAIFNLKLPMKKRYDEVVRCRAAITDDLSRRGVRAHLALRQLYHDREEVTGYLARRD
jgi:23S rRNA (cytidine2498-2'-O)-methyltransferase